jgi:hypothetical protein
VQLRRLIALVVLLHRSYPKPRRLAAALVSDIMIIFRDGQNITTRIAVYMESPTVVAFTHIV